MSVVETELISFQRIAVRSAHNAILRYEPTQNLFTGSSTLTQLKRGSPKPYLHRIRAVTGAGKTPILAALATQLKDGIILWTTPRTAVISQTLDNLRGKYRNLLPNDTGIYDLADVSTAEWEETLTKETGVTVLVATVASFNQDKGKLKLYQGEPSRWDELKARDSGGRRQRRIYVFYDEGHSATERQFAKLLELTPYAFVLASASELSEDLYPLLPGEDVDEKQRIYNEERTTVVKTSDVVSAGLLKRRIEIYDLDESWPIILSKANKKWEYIKEIAPQPPIACFIVDSTDDGVAVWRELRKLGVTADKIAVHLSDAAKRARILNSGALPVGFVDTYTLKYGPREIRMQGFTHLIWNLSLQEGWDEPWAYVAYVHNIQHSPTKIQQRIGRLIRNPFRDEDGTPVPADDSDLDTAFFYMNCDNEVFADFLAQFKKDLNTDEFEVFRNTFQRSDKSPRFSEPRKTLKCHRLFLKADGDKMTKDFLKELIVPAEAARHAEGTERHVRIDLDTLAEEAKETTLGASFEMTCSEIIRGFLLQKDWRLIKAKGSVGAWLRPALWSDQKLSFSVCYTSEGQKLIEHKCNEFCEKVDDYLTLISEKGIEYEVSAFKLNNPNGGTSDSKQSYYKVRKYKYSVHPEYNGFNSFELDVANALDDAKTTWARNPPKTGFGVPLFRAVGTSTEFYPDFIVWKGANVCCIEPKGRQLIEDALTTKLSRLPSPLSLFMVTDAGIMVDKRTGKITASTDDAYTVTFKNHNGHFRCEYFSSMKATIKFCLDTAFK